MDKVQTLLLVLIGCIAVLIIILIYLFLSFRKRNALAAIYASDTRDYRFACSLLKLYFKDRLIRSPYLRKNLGNAPLRADALLVLRGGIVIITVIDAPGFYSTPAEGDWRLTVDDQTKRIPNSLMLGQEQVGAVYSMLIRSGIECHDIYNIVLLSDDHAQIDQLYTDGVFTGDLLIPYCKKLNSKRVLKGSVQKEIKSIIVRNHKLCKSYIEKNVFENSRASEPAAPVESGARAGEEITTAASEQTARETTVDDKTE